MFGYRGKSEVYNLFGLAFTPRIVELIGADTFFVLFFFFYLALSYCGS